MNYFHGNNIKIFAANSIPNVAKQIADRLGLELGSVDVQTFSDGEVYVSLKESVRGADCFIIQSTCSPVNDNLMQILVMIDAMKRASAACITVVMPYFGYARQDRKAKPRDPISAKLVADLLTAAGADRIITMDLHAMQIQGFFNIPVDHLKGAPVLVDYFRDKIEKDKIDEHVVVSPDLGSIMRARSFASKLGCQLAVIDKRRPRPNVCEIVNIIGNVTNKKVILVDDMIDTAGTLCNAANELYSKYNAKEIYACATHGVLSGPAMERIKNSPIEKVFLLDTIPEPENKIDKLVYLPVADLFAEAINLIYKDESITPLSN